MFISKGFSEGEVVTLKLTSGEEIVAKLVEDGPLYYKLKNPQDSTLIFESRFESGNLQRVIQVGDYEYDLELKFDHYTTSMYS
jgi:hypothetical protein